MIVARLRVDLAIDEEQHFDETWRYQDSRQEDDYEILPLHPHPNHHFHAIMLWCVAKRGRTDKEHSF